MEKLNIIPKLELKPLIDKINEMVEAYNKDHNIIGNVHEENKEQNTDKKEE